MMSHRVVGGIDKGCSFAGQEFCYFFTDSPDGEEEQKRIEYEKQLPNSLEAKQSDR